MNRKQQIDKDAFEQAGRELLGQVYKAEHIDKQQILAAWGKVEARTDKPLFRRLRYVLSVAASIAILLSAGLYIQYRETEHSTLSLALLSKAVPTLSGNEILLIVEDDQKQLKNDVSITYASNGQSNVESIAVQAATNQLIVPKGRMATVTFSEGTKMYVKAGTQVIYPTVFSNERREIVVEGEVYLEVSKDTKRPFIVKANGFDVNVRGTAFNVSAYKDAGAATVVLVNGSVEVATSTNGKTLLAPNQLMEITSKGTAVKEVDVFAYICWKDKMMLLDGKTLGEVVDRLSSYYGCTIHCEADIRAIPVSGKLDLREEIGEMVDILCQSLFLQYTINQHTNIEIFK